MQRKILPNSCLEDDNNKGLEFGNRKVELMLKSVRGKVHLGVIIKVDK